MPNALTEIINQALAYPGLKETDIGQSYYFLTKKYNTRHLKIDPNRILIRESGVTNLEGAEIRTPIYDISFEHSGFIHTLKNRTAILGIGSNSSPEVLERKFSNFMDDRSKDFVVFACTLHNYAAVHSAFVGGLGPVPATIYKESGTETFATIGFYTWAQAKHITRTEPNYDGILLQDSITIKDGPMFKQPLVYSSIWGGLKDPQNSAQPLAQAAIPSTTSFNKVSTPEAIAIAAAIIEKEDGEDVMAKAKDMTETDIRNFIEGHLAMLNRQEAQMERTFCLQAEAALPANTQGVTVFESSYTRQMKAIDAHMQLECA